MAIIIKFKDLEIMRKIMMAILEFWKICTQHPEGVSNWWRSPKWIDAGCEVKVRNQGQITDYLSGYNLRINLSCSRWKRFCMPFAKQAVC